MKNIKHGLIIITPVFEDSEASACLFSELTSQFPGKVFVVAVDDGSVSKPLEISSLYAAGIDGVILKLCRNFGHQCAIAVGMAYVSERVSDKQSIVVMDSDGEDLPEKISVLLAMLESDEVDVAVAQRKNRVEKPVFKIFYRLYKIFFRLMTGRNIDFGNFMALKTKSMNRLVAMQELSIHLAGAVLASRLRIGICAIDRGRRYTGHSKMNFVGLVLHGFRGLMVFGEDVLVRVGIACATIAMLSVLGIVGASLLKLFGFSTPGWFSVALGILVLMLLQTGALALMSLLLTVIVRRGPVTSITDYSEFIEVELHTDTARENMN